MASQLDKIVQIKRFTDLKANVKAECQKRKYIGSVEAYGSSEWDYSNTSSTTVPTKNKDIQKDHYNKISIPLRKINWTRVPNGPLNREINDYDLLNFETTWAAFNSRTITDRSATDCSESCTGTCTTNCDTTCYGGCEGGCGSNCTGGCDNTCKRTCSGVCTVVCVGYTCQAACSGCTCGDGCEHSCTISCATAETCAETCSTDCYGGCADTCATGCGQSCRPCGCTPYTYYE